MLYRLGRGGWALLVMSGVRGDPLKLYICYVRTIAVTGPPLYVSDT
jgi:hypothetical protein